MAACCCATGCHNGCRHAVCDGTRDSMADVGTSQADTPPGSSPPVLEHVAHLEQQVKHGRPQPLKHLVKRRRLEHTCRGRGTRRGRREGIHTLADMYVSTRTSPVLPAASPCFTVSVYIHMAACRSISACVQLPRAPQESRYPFWRVGAMGCGVAVSEKSSFHDHRHTTSHGPHPPKCLLLLFLTVSLQSRTTLGSG